MGDVKKYADEEARKNAPLGTKAPAIGGGHWVKVKGGWKWFSGSTFPMPGGDWNGELVYPDAQRKRGGK